MRLGLSVGKVYMSGTEGYSGQNWGNTDWEASGPMQLQRGVRLGSRMTYAAPEFDVQEPDRFKNSDLRSKCPTCTAYIHESW